jgi:hypothetical protein
MEKNLFLPKLKFLHPGLLLISIDLHPNHNRRHTLIGLSRAILILPNLNLLHIIRAIRAIQEHRAFRSRRNLLIAQSSRWNLRHSAILIRLLSELRHNGLRKVSSGNPLGKKPVHLCVSAALGLRDAEVGVDEADSAEADPEPSGHGPPVPGCGVQLEGRDNAVEDAERVVADTRDVDGLGLCAG